MQSIAIFASGSGTNAQRIIEYFSSHRSIAVKLVLCNKPGAFVLERARNLNIPSVVFNRHEFYESTSVLDLLKENGIDYLVLAGFLWLVPDYLLEAYDGRIINIHPALLPKYGGKGMYGHHVHESVIRDNEVESGITIHHVNGRYDEGNTIFQAKCPVLPGDTPETLASRIHQLEYEYFPLVIEKFIDPASGISLP
jgi:phosphoribosylglycinamide formyltransferase 1